MDVLLALFHLVGIVGLWLWFGMATAVCMVADAKNRNALLALLAFIVAGPAALFYYFAVPTLRRPAPASVPPLNVPHDFKGAA